MYKIFSNLEYLHVYIDNLLVMSCSTFEEHLQWLELVFSQLSESWTARAGKCESHYYVPMTHDAIAKKPVK
jgi:hypothetical protein